MGGSRQSILVAERSEELRESLSATLRAEGWDVQTAGSGRGISMAWTKRMPDLLLLDAQIADTMVDRQLARWRQEGWKGRLVLLGPGSTGVAPDDVVARPVVVQELIASIADWLGGDADPTVLRLRHCTLDLERQAIDYPDGTGARLTTKEAEFLTYLARNAGRTVGRDELLEQVWGYRLGAVTRSRSVDKMLARLRPKLRDSASEPEHIFTVYGGGYRFVALEAGGRDADGPADEGGAPSNLPAPGGDFVGRADDVADLDEDLESGARVITIVGPGGVGKTRLALHQCQKLLASSPPAGGIWFCDLTEARSLEDVIGSVAGVLQLDLADVDDAAVEVGRALAEAGSPLLLLDNVEQVVIEVAELVTQWLASAPRTRFMVTSREPLRITQERCFELEGMLLPDAVALFTRRARGLRRTFELTDPSRVAVEELAERLDRLPLAIELAAARTTTMTPEKICDRIRRDLDDLLRHSDRHRPERQATLEGAVRWSWNLLSRWEQATLAQCSVFRGGFFLEAAEAIVDLSAYPDAPPVLEAVEGLVLRSLLRREVLPGLGEVRFRLYATIRSFAGRRAETLGLSAGVAARSQIYFLALADKLGADIATRDRPEALRLLALEADNLLEVHRRAVATSRRAAVEAALALDPLMTARGSRAAHVRLLDEAVELSSGLSGQARARTLCARGEARRLRGDFVGAEADLLPALALAQESADDSLVGQVSRTLGALRYRQGRGDEATEHYRRALAHAQAAQRPAAEAFAHGRLGAALQLVGRVPEAMAHYREAIEISRRLQQDRRGHLMVGSVIVVDLDTNTTLDRDGVGYAALSHLFGATLPVGRAREAEKALTQSLAYAREAGDQLGEAALMASLGLSRLDAAVAGEAGALTQAEIHLQAALDVIEQFGNLLAEASIMGCLGRVHHAAGDLERAAATLRESKLLSRRIGARRVEAFVTALLGAVTADSGHANAAELLLEEAQRLAIEVGDPLAQGVVLVAMGHLDLARGDSDTARARPAMPVGDDDGPTPRKMAVGAVDIRLAMHALEQALARAEAA